MLKKKILKELKQKLTEELEKIKESYQTTRELVQNGDLKSDGKYDTRATELNYLADGQKQRVIQLEQELELLEKVSFSENHESLAIGHLVEIALNDQVRTYFIAPTAGGTMLNISGQVVLVISVFSPIGAAALGLSVGDGFQLEINQDVRDYEIISIK